MASADSLPTFSLQSFKIQTSQSLYSLSQAIPTSNFALPISLPLHRLSLFLSPMLQILQVLLAGAASFVAIAIIFFFVFLLCQCKPTSRAQPRTRSLRQSRSDAAAELNSIEVGESASFDPCVQELSMNELIDATNNFDPELIIGDGSFGWVYKAKLSTGVTVAVKKLSPDAFQGPREFRAEMETLGKLRHKNIVKILGYCVSGRDRVLIYEFIEKGSLDQWLQETSLPPSSSSSDEEEEEVRLPLSWEVRVKVVKGVAKGLAFMHMLETPIVHRDIKPSNVLLDREFEAHIADFGLARRIEGAHSHVSTQAAGTMGYMPPEYRAGLPATVKADVYSFGVLMFEVATGKRPNWPVKEDDHEIWMLDWAKIRISENKRLQVVDPSIPREYLRDKEVREFLRIADLCTSEKPKDRPPMLEVVEMLGRVSSL